jgi:hypothetical protein
LKRIDPIAILSYDTPKKAPADTDKVEFPHLKVLAFNFIAIQPINWTDAMISIAPIP